MKSKTLLSVEKYSLSIGGNRILKDISFSIQENEIVALVGESGSGKSLTALSLLGLLPEKHVQIDSGVIRFLSDKNLLNLSHSDWRKVRGKEIGMIFQEPQSSLNPSMKCGEQVAEIVNEHYNSSFLSKKEVKEKVLSMFEKVKLPSPELIYNSYPHEISGGQKQRVMIAMALICEPKLLIADEPTTALDVLVQKEIVELIKELQQSFQMSVLFISHDLTLVSQLAEKIVVLYHGEVVEKGNVKAIFENPKENYTRSLIKARPSTTHRLKRLPTIEDYVQEKYKEEVELLSERSKRYAELHKKEPILQLDKVSKTYYRSAGFFRKKIGVEAVKEISFDLYPGETLGLVGASGCGKSTLGRSLVFLEMITDGTIRFRNEEWAVLSSKNSKELRRIVQFVFQDPYAALHPKKRIGASIEELLRFHKIVEKKESSKRVEELLLQVGLSSEFTHRYPHELSGGQRQRVVIAKALSVNPKIVILDEAVAALDISVQAQILNLLKELQQQYGLSYLFISHDMGVVKYLSDRVMVMHNGEIVECEETDALFAEPKSKYTQQLIAATPSFKVKKEEILI